MEPRRLRLTPTGGEDGTVARYAFPHSGTSMEMVAETLATMA
ncbi:hypothetical protein [Streptosporangium roseum]